MTLAELLKKANGFKPAPEYRPTSDDVEVSESLKVASELRKMASDAEREDRLDKLAAAVAIYVERHPEALSKLAKKDEKETYPVSRAVTNPGVRAALAVPGGAASGMAAGAAAALKNEKAQKALANAKTPQAIQKTLSRLVKPKHLAIGGMVGAGVAAGLSAAQVGVNRVIHARALKGRERKGTAWKSEQVA